MKDIELYLNKQYGLTVPSTGADAQQQAHTQNGTTSDKPNNQLLLKSIQKSRISEAHRRRLQLIQKSKQRYSMQQMHRGHARHQHDAEAT